MHSDSPPISSALTPVCRFLLALIAVTALGPRADAGDVGAFITLPTPTEAWRTGFGFHAAIFSLPFFQAGGEFAHMGAEDLLISISTYTAQAEFAPPSIKIKPFVGVGAGAYRLKAGDASDWGTLTSIFGGVKVPVGPARLRAEFRKVSLSGKPRPNFDKRYSLGVTFGF